MPNIIGTSSGWASSLSAANDERLEVPREEVGQVEGRRLLLLHRVPRVVAGEEAVAMGARQPLHTVPVQHDVERAGRAAIGVRDEDPLVAPSSSVSFASTAPAICAGVEWSFAGRQRTSTCVHPLRRITASTSRAIAPQARMSTSGRSVASNATSSSRSSVAELTHRVLPTPPWPRARRASTSACAVSAATAASRQ